MKYPNIPGRTRFGMLAVVLMSLVSGMDALAASDLTKVRLGIVSYIGDATHYHAYRSGYFADEGLDVELVVNGAGVQSMKQVANGEIDIGGTAPTPIVYLAMGRIKAPDNIRVIASVIHSTKLNHLIILDRNRHPGVRDLAGKRLGLQAVTASEFFWHNVAIAHDLDPDSVTIVDTPTRMLAQAAAAGDIDAAVAWSPFHQDVSRAVDTPTLEIGGGSFYTTAWHIVVRPDYLERNPGIVRGYLRAMLRAEQDIRDDPARVARLHAELVDSTPDELVQNYRNVVFDMNLSEADLLNLTQQGEWALKKGYVSGRIPDFREYFAIAPLKSVKPRAIKLLE